ncbi:glycosyltransferase family 39 protein [Lewinella sp. W8]|uniref:ArnT family glycosyltransferase n=1 Tax=Lewinella sp. W8 TaxID=2528208 RepID=UPI001068BDBC|nr:glycosyltransferase family 39 protein [Lewinella sp. W8]MTB51815.1 hypothetical protein [Lewinella sp. W8]
MQLPRREISPLWLLATWLVINLIQAAASPLDADETYYWMYSNNLDWGYFDHPPMVALLISMGKDWLPGALGVRFGHVLAGTATLAAIWHLLDHPKGQLLWLAAALIFVQPILHVYGFIATPDGPLLLFSALYLIAYRNFLAKGTIKHGLLWGITMAGLLYSKYHGVLLILLTVLPQIGYLIRKPGAWIAALGGALLFVPHLYWQYAHDFPSFRYHLSGRDDAYRLEFTLSYLLNQLVVFSPFLLYHYWNTLFRVRSKEAFAGALRWLVPSFLIFFLVSTLKGRTEAQWTALLSIPLIYLVFRAAVDNRPQWQPQLWKLCLWGGGILLVFRLLLIAPRTWIPFPKPFDHEPWTERLAELAGDRPVIVQNSYRLASLYTYYTGKPAWTTTDVFYRLNQYDLWPGGARYHNQSVLMMGQNTWYYPAAEPFVYRDLDMRIMPIDSMQMLRGTRLNWRVGLPDTLIAGAEYPIEISVQRPAQPDYTVELHRGLPMDLFITLYHKKVMDFVKLRPLISNILPADSEQLLFAGTITIPEDAVLGKTNIELGLGYQGMPPLRGQSALVSAIILPAP